MSRKSTVELGDTSSGPILGLVPLKIRVDKVDEPLYQVQKSVHISKIQSGIGGHQFRNTSRTVPLEIRVDKMDEPKHQV